MRGLPKDLVRIAMAVLSILLTVMGCDGPRTRVVSMSSSGPQGANAAKATIRDGLATFQCIDSVAGACTYVLFLRDCRAGAGDPACAFKPIEEFTLKKGMSKRIVALPQDFEFCVGHGARPTIPDCQ
ncbi:hypothetical protein M2650_05590 [Luteimonas sp. SX5]|uniref:Lipoprotein n=1 Tax=Luteimonas galliterrae TaxID=2940486 RepID=A0ABT0MGX1_9GAMM|nr:hypothetical protein [Luteimonas galliterrae]MCL1634104.1 hypothetical protein [Luteimonas galliterrae]